MIYECSWACSIYVVINARAQQYIWVAGLRWKKCCLSFFLHNINSTLYVWQTCGSMYSDQCMVINHALSCATSCSHVQPHTRTHCNPQPCTKHAHISSSFDSFKYECVVWSCSRRSFHAWHTAHEWLTFAMLFECVTREGVINLSFRVEPVETIENTPEG